MKLALLLCIMFLASCQTPQKGIPIRIGISQSVSYLPIFLAHSLGYFADEGLSVQLDELNSSGRLAEAVLGGSVDATAVGFDQNLQVLAKGAQVRTFFVLGTRPTFVLVAAPGRPEIHRVEDLKGRTIGVSALGANAHNILNLILLKHGVRLTDVTTVGIGSNAAAAAAVENAKVDAAILLPVAYETLRERKPEIRVLLDAGADEANKLLFGVPQVVQTVVMARADWLARNPDTARRITRALSRAARWMHEQPIETVVSKMPDALGGAGSAPARRSLVSTLPFITTDGRVPKGGPEAIRDFLRLTVDPAFDVDLAKTYTEEFLEPKQ